MRACVLRARKFTESLIKIDDRPPLFVPDSTTLSVPVIVLRLIIFAIHTLNEKRSDHVRDASFFCRSQFPSGIESTNASQFRVFLHRKHDSDVVSDLISTLTKTNDER